MTAHVMADDFVGPGIGDLSIGGHGERASASRMRKLVEAFTARRQSSKAGIGIANHSAVDAGYFNEAADDGEWTASLVEEQEAALEASTPDWPDQSSVAEGAVREHERDDDLSLRGDDENDRHESVPDAPQNAEDESNVMWDELTPLDIERARTVLTARRDEMLARHAAELQVLDQEKAQVASLSDAVGVFLRRYAATGEPSALP